MKMLHWECSVDNLTAFKNCLKFFKNQRESVAFSICWLLILLIHSFIFRRFTPTEWLVCFQLGYFPLCLLCEAWICSQLESCDYFELISMICCGHGFAIGSKLLPVLTEWRWPSLLGIEHCPFINLAALTISVFPCIMIMWLELCMFHCRLNGPRIHRAEVLAIFRHHSDAVYTRVLRVINIVRFMHRAHHIK